MEISARYKKIVAWGAGRAFENADIASLNIEYVVDSDKNKQGENINGVMCRSPEEILSENVDETAILITTFQFIDVMKQINNIGFKGDVLFFDAIYPNPFCAYGPFTRSYALFCEDAIIGNMCSRYGVKIKRYIDIGGNHPIFGNATYRFYEIGSRGVAIEPDSSFEDEWQRYRPNDTFLNVGLSDAAHDGHEMPFYFCSEANTRSTLSAERAELNKQLGYECKKRAVAVRSLDKVIEEYGEQIDYISMDIEGSEYQCLKDFDFEKYKISFFNVETSGDDRIMKLFIKNGYEVAALTISNIVVVRKGIIKEE